MHTLCLRGQQLAQAHGQGGAQRQSGSVGVAQANDDAAILERWVADCVTLLRYVPETAPVHEDHKRLMMLLHDLGGSALLIHLLGALARPIVGVSSLAKLAGFIGDGFGEWNRKTALTRALSMAERSRNEGTQLEAVQLLRDNGLCTPPSYSADSAQREEENDMWAQVGVRACATLLLRGRRTSESLQLLRSLVAPSPTLHAFLSAFEVASRLPAAPPSTAKDPPPPLRFELEHMLEVLEAALERPQHGLASEGNLLRWQLRTSMQFGQAAPPAPPLACAPPQPMPLLSSPRVLIVMPFVDTERKRLRDNLKSWRDGGGVEPCTVGGGGGGESQSDVDFMLYAAGTPSKASWFTPPERLFGGGAASCFRRVSVRHANLSAAEQHYVGGWDNTGPNNLFYRLFLDPWLHESYDVLLWMETDLVPVQPQWISRLLEEARAPRGFWRKGPAQQPRLQHSMVSTHHYHMNTAGLYRLGQPCFIELMRRVASEYPQQPHDVSTHIFLHDPRHFHIWQTHAHRFLYTDFVQNRLDAWSLEEVRQVSPDTVLVHGKTRRDESG
jgi:hypothetical protein